MTFNLADKVDPGTNRLWHITHRPTAAKPVRLELRERTIDAKHTHQPLSFTRLLGQIDTIADEAALMGAAEELFVRVGRVDEFAGVHERGA